MADYFKDIYPLISKPLKVAQEQMNWLKGFQAQQAQQQQQAQYQGYYNGQQNTGYPSTSFSNGWGNTTGTSTAYKQGPYSGQYPIPPYNPASSFQMQQLIDDKTRLQYQLAMQKEQQRMQAENKNTANSTTTDLTALLLPLLLMKLLEKKKSSSGTDNDDDDAVDAATAKITELLQKTVADDGTADTDADNRVISPADFTTLKAAVTDGQFTKSDLESSLGNMMLTSDLDQVDELVTLLAMSQDDGLIDIDTTLPPSVLSALSTQRKDLLAAAIAEKGLIKGSGGANQDLSTFLVTSLDKGVDTIENQFAKLTVKALVNRWIITPPAVLPDADQDQLVSLLKLQGFKFNLDGSLKPNAEQPFPVLP